ncbi:PIG-L deacetylase family protein [Halobacteriovorax sp. YZS-1-1]|uniref:PIG-L deacetylase family protein n=1 Tax=unclassified Halobacteriovorax TaxID=2639665 RepID=UPI0039998324
MNKNILIVVAHADDEVLGCGATISKHIRNKDNVSVLVLTDSSSAQGKDINIRHNEFLKAMNILGVEDFEKLDYKDNRLDSYDLVDIVKDIEIIKEKINPDIVYTHSYNDLNLDHQITNKAVLTAFRPLPNYKKCNIFAFDIPSSIEYQSVYHLRTNPNYYNTIDEIDLKIKIQAMMAYETELHPFPHPRSIENLEISAKKEGTMCGEALAESFYIERLIN